MLVVETIAKIRRAHFVDGKPIKQICRELKLSRKVVRKVLRSEVTAFEYKRSVQPHPKLGAWRDELERLLSANAARGRRERVTLLRIFEDLRGLGYEGGYDAVRRYAAAWRRQGSTGSAAAFVPLSFDPGEAYQFDWSHEVVLIDDVTVTVKVAHMRLCHSRMPFVRAYPRETQEMVFDAHDRAFAFYKGACTRGIYDNMKTAVDTVFVGKERAYNRRFLQMCSHYIVEPVACTPASGWEKGQVENQVGTIRERLFSPRVRVKSMEELNDWLLDQCVARAKVQPHPEIADKTVWEVFEAERASLVPYRCRFDGVHAVQASVSKTCLVRFDNNKYSVQASAVGRPVEVRAYADRIELRQDGRVVGEHARAFGRGGTVYNPWHYVPVLARKPGALRNGAPFKHWVLPAAIERVRRKLRAMPDGDRQMVEILGAVLSDGLPRLALAAAEGAGPDLSQFADRIVVLSFVPEGCGAPCADQQALLQTVQEAVNATPMREMVQFLTVGGDVAPDPDGEAGNWRPVTPADETVTEAAAAFAALSARGADAPMIHVIDRGGRHAGVFHGPRFGRINLVLYINGLTNAPPPEPGLLDRLFGAFR